MTEFLLGAAILGASAALLWISRPINGKMRPFLANGVDVGVAIVVALGIAFGVAKMVMAVV